MINIIGLSLCWVGELFMRPRGVGFGNEGCPQGNEQCSPGYEGCVKGNAYDTVSTGFFQEGPKVANMYTDDQTFRNILRQFHEEEGVFFGRLRPHYHNQHQHQQQHQHQLHQQQQHQHQLHQQRQQHQNQHEEGAKQSQTRQRDGQGDTRWDRRGDRQWEEQWSAIDEKIKSFGQRCVDVYCPMLRNMERNKPWLEHRDAFGKHVNRLHVCHEWVWMKKEAARQQLVHQAYNKHYRDTHHSMCRLVQFSMLHVYSANSGMFGCPLAMTDGAAALLESLIEHQHFEKTFEMEYIRNVFSRLTSEKPDQFITSGQWMTERGGGSDVRGGTRTIAIPTKDHLSKQASGPKSGVPYTYPATHNLYGYKWFSSATDADIAITLANTQLSVNAPVDKPTPTPSNTIPIIPPIPSTSPSTSPNLNPNPNPNPNSNSSSIRRLRVEHKRRNLGKKRKERKERKERKQQKERKERKKRKQQKERKERKERKEHALPPNGTLTCFLVTVPKSHKRAANHGSLDGDGDGFAGGDHMGYVHGYAHGGVDESRYGHGEGDESGHGPGEGVEVDVEGSVKIIRLKDKLGTRQLPTGEIQLTGVPGIQISREGRGISTISQLVNITRLHTAIAATSYMSKALLLAQDYARKRIAFGSLLQDNELHLETLASIRVVTTAGLMITLSCAKHRGRVETLREGVHRRESDLLLRLLTPVAKIYASKCCVMAVSEALECLGGMGYIESSGLPVLLRDGQVLPIWEGTTNVLSMDVRRVILKHPKVMDLFESEVERLLCCDSKSKTNIHEQNRLSNTLKAIVRGRMKFVLKELSGYRHGSKARHATENRHSGGYKYARDDAINIAKLFCGAALIHHAAYTGVASDWLAADMYVRTGLQENGWGGIGGVNVGRGITSSMTAKHRSEGEFRFDLSALKELALGAACHQKPQPLRSRL